MLIEIIHSRDPDSACDILVYIDGKDATQELGHEIHTFDIDPGAGYTLADWRDGTEADVASATPPVAERLRRWREDAESSPYITEG